MWLLFGNLILIITTTVGCGITGYASNLMSDSRQQESAKPINGKEGFKINTTDSFEKSSVSEVKNKVEKGKELKEEQKL